jgi:alanyl aminopeptidase
MLARFVRHLVLFVVPVAAIAAMDRDPMPPAFRLGDAATPSRYELHLAIDPRASDFTGDVAIELEVQRATEVLWLNATALTIDKVTFTQGGRDIPVTIVPGGEDFIGLRGRFASGAARVRFTYRGKLDPLLVEGLFRQQDGNEWYVLSQFEAISARRAFPCFDEPAWKTPWRVTVDAPAANVVVANTPQTDAAAIADRPGWWRHEFAETRPLPTYLVALAVGPFDVVNGGTAGVNHTPLRYLTPKGRGREARYAAAITPRLVERLEDYFGIPYPFEKLDSITIPHLVTFGAMENVGLITYGSELMLADAHEETPHFRELYAGLAAHEIAHMWFGNLVTLKWWDDTWLNEAFASWMGSKVVYAFQPAWDNGVQSGKSRHAALVADRLASARSIAAPVDNRNAIDDAFDDITYNKGEEVLAMFEAWLGPDRFKAGVRGFLRKHSYGTATSDDFFRALGQAAGESEMVIGALKGFVNQPGAPLIDLRLNCESTPTIEVRQRRLRPKGSTMQELEWTTPACFHYRVAGKDLQQCAEITAQSGSVELRNAPSCPSWIVGNAGGRGHYVVRYWPELLRQIASRAARLPFARGAGPRARHLAAGRVGSRARLDRIPGGRGGARPRIAERAARGRGAAGGVARRLAHGRAEEGQGPRGGPVADADRARARLVAASRRFGRPPGAATGRDALRRRSRRGGGAEGGGPGAGAALDGGSQVGGCDGAAGGARRRGAIRRSRDLRQARGGAARDRGCA